MAYGNNNDDSLISRLLEETYQSLPKQDDPCRSPDLSEHFERHFDSDSNEIDPTLENFLNRSAAAIVKLSYLARTGCYHLRVGAQELDLPGNWGAFAKLGRDTSYIDLSHDEITSILSPMLGGHEKLVLVGHFGAARLAFFSNEDEFSMRWLEKYFAAEEKKEAA